MPTTYVNYIVFIKSITRCAKKRWSISGIKTVKYADN